MHGEVESGDGASNANPQDQVTSGGEETTESDDSDEGPPNVDEN